jgi:ADP-heptose:LPS heptosyltransferase
MNYSKLVIAPDSSFVHIAAGLSIPVIGLYAPFAAEVRMSTYPNCDWIQPKKDDDRICSYGGRRCFLHGNKCPVNINLASPCFYNIDFDEGLTKIQKLLEKTNA